MAESADSPMNQEILLGGHFYLMVLKVSMSLHHIVHVLTPHCTVHPLSFSSFLCGKLCVGVIWLPCLSLYFWPQEK